MPYTLPLSIRGDFSTIRTGFDWWGGMPDPFDPRFAMAAERAIAIAAPRPDHVSCQLRLGSPAVFSRVQQGATLIDLRTVLPDDDDALVRRILDCAIE